MASSRSKPLSSRPETSALVSDRCHFGKEDLKSGKEVTPGQTWSSGVPRSLRGAVSTGGKFGEERVGGWCALEDLEDFVDLGVAGK